MCEGAPLLRSCNSQGGLRSLHAGPQSLEHAKHLSKGIQLHLKHLSRYSQETGTRSHSTDTGSTGVWTLPPSRSSKPEPICLRHPSVWYAGEHSGTSLMQSSNILLEMELPCTIAVSGPESVLATEKQSKRSPAQLCSATEAQSKSFKI